MQLETNAIQSREIFEVNHLKLEEKQGQQINLIKAI
jgi:hypothetical protein